MGSFRDLITKSKGGDTLGPTGLSLCLYLTGSPLLSAASEISDVNDLHCLPIVSWITSPVPLNNLCLTKRTCVHGF